MRITSRIFHFGSYDELRVLVDGKPFLVHVERRTEIMDPVMKIPRFNPLRWQGDAEPPMERG